MNTGLEVVNDFKIDRHDWHDPLVKACCNFVKFKDDLDLSNRTSSVHPFLVRKLRWLLRYYEPSEKLNRHGRPRRKATATYPSHFMHFALPFLCNRTAEVGEYEKRLIHPQLVVSGSYRKYNHGFFGGYAGNRPDEVMDGSDKTVEECETESCDPKYLCPGGLPLYVALEGKNRVDLFKRHRSAMLAWVAPSVSLSAESLKLIRLKPFNVWAICHDGRICVLPFSDPALPVYKALNVAMAKPKWDLLALIKLRNARISAVSFQMSS
ncbi:hypothetical protein RA290_22635 (plasmid) [Pantoea agglomerans]|uniref:hypothetical protein n=1 Tax=Enterobacter agglomerans TaxID=549 RepID=UPI003AAD3092